MQRKQDGLFPTGETFDGLGGPGKTIREALPQARHHFTQAAQVNQLVSTSEVDADLGFMARMMALCCLPRMVVPGPDKTGKNNCRPPGI